MTITMVHTGECWSAYGMGPVRKIVVEGATRAAARTAWHRIAHQQRQERELCQQART